MLAHVLLWLLVFKHGFIQIRFGSFKFFYAISFLLNFTRYLFSEIFPRYLLQFFLLMRNITMLDVGYWSKSISWKYFIFHEMTLKLYFMKCPDRKISQCILPLTNNRIKLLTIYLHMIKTVQIWDIFPKWRIKPMTKY